MSLFALSTPLGIFSFDEPIWLAAALVLLPIAFMLARTRRRLGAVRMGLVGLVRTLLVLLLVAALAGLTRRTPVDTLGVVFVLDHSSSVGTEGRRAAREFVEAALPHQGADDVAGVVVFGADAAVESEPKEELVFEGISSVVSPHHTDISAGIRLGTAVLPSDRARRIVVISDGEQTRGDAVAQAFLTAGGDLSVGVVPLGTRSGPEILADDILAPARVDEGAPFDIRVVARSTTDTEALLKLYRNEVYLGQRRVTLSADRAEIISVRQEAEKPGLYRYEARLHPVDEAGVSDTLAENNVAISTVQVTGRPRVLYVEGLTDQAVHLRRVLVEQGLEVDVVRPEDVPPRLSELRRYAAVYLSDVPSYNLTMRQQEALESFVRDLGRGLAMLGGEQSFGPGGYYKTPIERALPVNMDLQDKTRFPKLGMVLALDKSCSMGGGAGSKMAMAKEAGIRTVELLQDRDMLGVIGFDSAASWIVKLVQLYDKKPVVDRIASIRVGGGTDAYPAIEAGVNGLNASDAALKHVIVLSDGIVAGGAYEQLIKQARANDVTVSTLAFGSDADLSTMNQWAKWGGGRFYQVSNPKQLPAIFTRETVLATRSFLVEETFIPGSAANSDLLEGFSESDLPTLHGYVATEAKARATVALISRDEYKSPVLAHWNYGLGRSLAFTSDVKARWGRDWVGTSEYTKFWSQATRWLIGSTEDQNLDVGAEIQDGELIVSVDAFDGSGGYRNFLSGEARVVAPDLGVTKVPLIQVGPGRYEGSIPVDQDGSWLVGVSMTAGDEPFGQMVAEAVQAYSPEYRLGSIGDATLAELGRVGGVGELTPEAVFARPEIARYIPQELWPYLLAVAAFLLLFDVALRRLDLGRRPKLAAGPDITSALSGVTRRKPRRRRKRRPVTVFKGEEDDEPPDDDVDPGPPPVEVDEASYAGRLLAARRSAKRKMGDDE